MSTTNDADAERWRSTHDNSRRWHRDRDCNRITSELAVPATETSIQFHELTACGLCADGPKPSDDQDRSDDECPVCGDETGSLGNHLRTDCEGPQ